MQPPTPSPPNRKKRGLPLPHAQATRGRREYQKEEEMRGQGGRGRGMEQQTRSQIMHNIFGYQSGDEEELRLDGGEEATGVNHNDQGDGLSDNSRRSYQWEEGKGESQQSDGITGESGEAHHMELSHNKMRGKKEVMCSEKEGYDQRIVTSRTRFVAIADDERKDEDAQTRKSGTKMDDEAHEVVREVFGDSDVDELDPYGGQDDTEDVNRLRIEDEGHTRSYLQYEDIVPDEENHYESDANFEREPKQRPIGSPMNIVAPPVLPPGQTDRMSVIKTSNVMGIDPKPFDPETYMQEDYLNTGESGGKKRICLKDNVVRYRRVKNADGTISVESNARFVKWKDGTWQLLIGNEAIDVSVIDSTNDHIHLFTGNGEGLLQSQGRLLQKMIFTPPSLSSRSHRSLTALVDSQNKKKVRIQTCHETEDPERVKQERERTEEENIRANSVLKRKREKAIRKHTQPYREKQQLTQAFLEDALDEVHEYSESEMEDLEYETEVEDIKYSPTNGRLTELDIKDGYDEDLQEAIDITSVLDEETTKQEHRGESRKGKAIVYDEKSAPPRKRPFNRGKAVVFYSDHE